MDAARRERRFSRRCQAVSSARPLEHPGEELLVGGGLRCRQPFDPAQRPAVPVGEQLHGPVANADGSIDIDFAPEAPTGSGNAARNWIQTTRGKGWFTLFRFYGPLEAFFEQTWKPDDIVEVKS